MQESQVGQCRCGARGAGRDPARPGLSPGVIAGAERVRAQRPHRPSPRDRNGFPGEGEGMLHDIGSLPGLLPVSQLMRGCCSWGGEGPNAATCLTWAS